MSHKRRLASPQKFIFIFDDQENESKYYELDDLGKIPRATFQPKKISIMKKYNSIDKDIKEMFIQYPYIFHHPLFSYSGNIEIFTTEKCIENNITMLDQKYNKTEKENDNKNDRTNNNLSNKQSINEDLFKLDTEKFSDDFEIDDYFGF